MTDAFHQFTLAVFSGTVMWVAVTVFFGVFLTALPPEGNTAPVAVHWQIDSFLGGIARGWFLMGALLGVADVTVFVKVVISVFGGDQRDL